jgi:adenosylcobinamide-GDP ribazoletransferase
LRLVLFTFLAALQFMTTLPVSLRRPVDSEDLARAGRYFPLVGLFLGTILALLYSVLILFLPPNLVTLLLVISLLALTGALHFDGFLDSCDGLFGYHTTERRLEIMRDSRVGSFGVAGGICLLALKYTGLSLVTPGLMPAALILAPLVARWALLCAVVIFPYGRVSGLGLIYKRYTHPPELVLASIFVIIIVLAFLGWPGLGLVAFIFGLTMLVGRWIMGKLPAGLTGDSYGAIAEITETATWLFIGAGAGWITGFSFFIKY